MQIIDAIILGLTQGLTEFIPVSSSGHLIIVGSLLDFEYSSLAFDTTLDIGTLLALYVFFAKDFYRLGHDLIFGGQQRRLAWYLIAATIPAVIAGVLVQGLAETYFRSNVLVAINLIWVGVAMLVVDRFVRSDRSASDWRLGKALAVGFAQCLALVPGVSRSGATITAARALGFDRISATRFSFLLSAPIITGATLKVLADGETIRQITLAPTLYAAGIVAAFVSGYAAIRFLLGYLSRHGLAPFAIYRIAAGIVILVIAGL